MSKIKYTALMIFYHKEPKFTRGFLWGSCYSIFSIM